MTFWLSSVKALFQLLKWNSWLYPIADSTFTQTKTHHRFTEDRPAYFSEFFKAFFNVDVLLGDRSQLLNKQYKDSIVFLGVKNEQRNY
jgi:hypothetical protein